MRQTISESEKRMSKVKLEPARIARKPGYLTTTLSSLEINIHLIRLEICCPIKIDLRKRTFFGVKEFFFVNFDFKNGCENEFEDNNEKSCRRFKNRVLP